MAENLPLAAEFPPATPEQWRKLVDGVLKGASFEQTLVSHTADGLTINPLYARKADVAPVAGRKAAAPWQVMQRIDHPDAGPANAQALDDLQNGASGLHLVFAGSIGAYGYGLAATETSIAQLLDGVYLDAGAPLSLDLSWHTSQAPDLIAKLLKTRNIAPAAADIRFNIDPLGALAATGVALVDWPTHAPRFAYMIKQWADQGFRGPFAQADGRVVHDAGGSETQELAFVLAAGVAYLRAFEAAGIALDQARGLICLQLAADADQFLTMAKFRSMRKLWARAEEASGLAPKPVFIGAQTAWRMMTRRDVYTNMLRTTIATFAAGLGGANAICILPHTVALGLPDAFARRVARNTQLILLAESNLAKVADPAAGAGGIEALTDQLCLTAWTLFQEIEKAGGLAAALAQGDFQKKVAATRAQREADIASGKTPLVGTTIYPNQYETPATVLDAKPHPAPDLPASLTRVAPMPAKRLAEAFEQQSQA